MLNTRMRKWLSAFVAGLLLAGTAAAIQGSISGLLYAQRSAQKPEQAGPVIRTEVNLVNVLFTVTDKQGRVLNDLRKEDFEVLEDGARQNIEYFSNYSNRSDIPLTIAMLVDTSGSEKFKLPVEKETAAEFFQKLLRSGKDLACLIQFDSDVALVQDFTDDLHRLSKALESLRAGNSTALYDAVYLAVNEKLQGETGRKVIVIISDGDDTSSKLKKGDALEAAQKADVVIYGIGVRDPLFHANFGVLESFAKETGGRFFKESAKFAELQRAFQMIGEDIKNQYSLAYTSTNKRRDGSFRRIEIKSRIKGLKINHRRGYYALKSS